MKKSVCILVTILSLGTVFNACKKTEDTPHSNPTGTFFQDAAYISSDAAVVSGKIVKVGLNFKWNGLDSLKTLKIYVNETQSGESFALTEGQGKDYSMNINITKSQNPTEKWTFEMTDAGNQSVSLTLTLTKDATGGAIFVRNDVSLGAQSNTTVGSLYAPSTNTVFALADAASNQAVIDIICGYDATNATFLSCPGANNLSGTYNFSTWTTKNVTYYNISTLSAEQFDLIDSDKLIIPAFNGSTQSKAKALAVGNIFALKTISGKYGLLKIKTVNTNATGSVTFDLKIQQ